ncbi:DUF4149 domain-containing protein [Ideonella sp.]|uniref:DUF4149 domain-containing protein n=1 Tax=Ideonella sp. TaxID=1929293 RepID=UPI0035AF26E4
MNGKALAARAPERLRRLLPGPWVGVLLCIALIATPAPFATLAQADAGRVVARIFAVEAPLSLALGVAMLLLERRAARAMGRGGWTWPMGLAALALFCTVAGYYGVQPMLAAARAGQGAWTFGQLHALSFGLFGLKLLAVAVLAWRQAGEISPGPAS